MALKFFHGWDNNSSNTDLAQMSNWTYAGTAASVGTGRFAGKCLQHNVFNNSAQSKRATGSNYASGTFGVAFKSSANVQTAYMVFYDTVANTQCFISISSTGLITAKNGAGSTYAGSSTYQIPSFTNSTWYYIECAVLISNTVGTFAVAVDGTTQINLTGLNTRSGSSNNYFNVVGMQTDAISFSSGAGASWDDMYVKDDTTMLGPQKIIIASATSANGSVQFTPAASTNVSQINETAIDGDSTYIYDGTVGHQDVFNYGTISSTITGIAGVQVINVNRKDDVGARVIQSFISQSGTVSNGASLSPASTYVVNTDLFLTDPATGAAFTAAGVNTLKAGVKVSA